jgi:hypothetical protein
VRDSSAAAVALYRSSRAGGCHGTSTTLRRPWTRSIVEAIR